MKTSHAILSIGATGAAALALATASAPAAMLVQYKAANFNNTTHDWTDSSGNGNTASDTGFSIPTLVTNATPNGSSAVQFSVGFGGWLAFNSIDLTTASGFTILAYATNPGGSNDVLIGGPNGNDLQYRFSNNKQQLQDNQVASFATGTATIPTGAFESISVAGTAQPNIASSASFRLNGASDGGGSFTPNSNLTSNFTQLGPSGTYGGMIAEIRVYNEVLTTPQIQAVETEFYNAYVVPEPAALALLLLGGVGLLRRRR
ncbi:MAG: LamG-like jellyroll fold domain-containing protein [Lentisphaeria bacterium]|jgi:hypothetical protein